MDEDEDINVLSDEELDSAPGSCTWTEREILLLERGIEIYDKSPERLAQFVGTKSALEIRNYLENEFGESSSEIDDFVDVTDRATTSNDVVSDIKLQKPAASKRKKVKQKVSKKLKTTSATTEESTDSEIDVECHIDNEDQASGVKTQEKLFSLETPTLEVTLNETTLTDLEKEVYQTFYPLHQRKDCLALYLKSRNSILSKWNEQKPEPVLKSNFPYTEKIHHFLEQIGAINFGCETVEYIRPLKRIFEIPEEELLVSDMVESRRTVKKLPKAGSGGRTIQHGEKGEIIKTTIVKENPPPIKVDLQDKQPVYLITCHESPNHKYKINLTLSTLILMDFHAHSSVDEVMGLIGGRWDSNTQTVTISHYEPCRNLASSTTHCDMCPLSQAESSEKIHNLKLDLLGWFHSHPTFAPEPSQTDLDTQKILQTWIGTSKPCLCFILSPFGSANYRTPSDYRCIIVEQGTNSPYKFHVEVTSDNFEINEFLRDVLGVYSFLISSKCKLIYRDPYIRDGTLSFAEKFIGTLTVTLDRFTKDEQIRAKIIKCFSEMCNTKHG